MNLPPEVKVTSELLWLGAIALLPLDLALSYAVARLVQPARFRRMKWALALAAAVVWLAIWTWVVGNFWEPVYQYVFPAWGRQAIPFMMSALFAGVALFCWRLARAILGHPVLAFCLLGGLWGPLTHLNAIRAGILEKPPMLAGASPAAALVFSFFEFWLYWCAITLAAYMGYLAWHRLHGVTQRDAREGV